MLWAAGAATGFSTGFGDKPADIRTPMKICLNHEHLTN
jgi:hypothetical protein